VLAPRASGGGGGDDDDGHRRGDGGGGGGGDGDGDGSGGGGSVGGTKPCPRSGWTSARLVVVMIGAGGCGAGGCGAGGSDCVVVPLSVLLTQW
jgi:hypothetical protein